MRAKADEEGRDLLLMYVVVIVVVIITYGKIQPSESLDFCRLLLHPLFAKSPQ
jgi:hypothetical protein